MRADKQTNYSNPYSYNHSSKIKCKRRMQTQITRRCVIEEETEELGEKPLCRPPSSNRSTRKSVGIHGLAKGPPSLIYPLYLSPLSSYSNKASRNRVLSSFSDPTTSSMLHLQQHQSDSTSCFELSLFHCWQQMQLGTNHLKLP